MNGVLAGSKVKGSRNHFNRGHLITFENPYRKQQRLVASVLLVACSFDGDRRFTFVARDRISSEYEHRVHLWNVRFAFFAGNGAKSRMIAFGVFFRSKTKPERPKCTHIHTPIVHVSESNALRLYGIHLFHRFLLSANVKFEFYFRLVRRILNRPFSPCIRCFLPRTATANKIIWISPFELCGQKLNSTPSTRSLLARSTSFLLLLSLFRLLFIGSGNVGRVAVASNTPSTIDSTCWLHLFLVVVGNIHTRDVLLVCCN